MAAVLSTTFAQPATAQTAVWTLASVTGVQKGHVCQAESELAQVLQVGPGLTLTVQRGIEGTATAAHATSTPVVVYRANEVVTGVPPISPATAPLRQATVTLTDAQIKLLQTTPVRMVAAPGVNRVIVAPVTMGSGQAVLALDWYGDYTNVDPAATWRFKVGTNGVSALYGGSGKLSSQFLAWGAGGASNPIWLLSPYNDVSGGGGMINSLSDFQNQPVFFSMSNALGNVTGGHTSNTLTVSILYSVLDVTTGLFV